MTAKHHILAVVALTIVVATDASAQADSVSRSWNLPVEPFRIVDGIYYVGASDIAAFLITTDSGHILLDGGFSETAPQIARNIEKLGFALRDVRILLSSHAHYDHAGGLLEMKTRTGARFYALRGRRACLFPDKTKHCAVRRSCFCSIDARASRIAIGLNLRAAQ